MKKFLKWTLIVVLGLVVLAAIAFPILKAKTKSNSPETTISYTSKDADSLDISVRFSRPFRKGRVILGGLVPYGRTWRTGANEATEFTTKTALTVADGKTLAAGKYTLWTIPEKDHWTVIWNSKQYMWGIKGKENGMDVASRDPEADVLKVEVPVMPLDSTQEQFQIELSANGMRLSWENVAIVVPMKK